MDARQAGPLDGLLVLDFSRVLAGPHCGRMLVDLGAEVIKIEPPDGDLSRFAVPRVNSLSTYYVQQNCGKRNLSLDLKRPEAVELLRRLAQRADVLLENFRPGVMARRGLGPETLLPLQPRLVYASITGYGQDGPWAQRRSYAPVIHAETGLLEGFARYRDLPLAQEPYSHADVYAALECLSAILAALYRRERTGRGQHIDVSMAETMLAVNEYAATSLSGMRDGETRRPTPVASPLFETASGVIITVGGDPAAGGNFHGYCRAMERPELLEDPRFAESRSRWANREALLGVIAEWVRGFDDVDVLEAALARGGLAMGVVASVAEAGASPWASARGAVVEVSDRTGGTLRIPNSPWRFSASRTGARGRPAYRGEDNRAVLTEHLGLDAAEIDALEKEGVLSSRMPDHGA